MATENEQAILDAMNFDAQEIDDEEIEKKLEAELEKQFTDLDFIIEEGEHINNPDHLGETILNVVWEQFMNQVASTAGEAFIKENNGLTLDLRNSAHIQTTENFADGKIATHNTKIDYQERYDDWQSNFVKDEAGNVVTHKTRTGKQEATLTKDARKPFDKERPKGSAENNTDMDHTVSAAEIIRDPGINAHMTKEEQIAFANSEKNLNEMQSNMNRSKGDSAMTDWLDNPNANGQKPDEIFDISPEEERRLREKDAEAREELEKQKKEAEKRSIEAGKQSQKEEFFKIGKQALRSVLMAMLGTLLKEIVGKLVLWFKSAERNVKTLVESIKSAIKSFVGKLKQLLVNTTESVLTTIATSIIGPVIGTIKKTITLLRQGWKSLKEAVDFLRKPENKGKPLSYLLPQVGIIVITGLSGIGAIVLGEFIEKALMNIPFLAVDIPFWGSPANLIGSLMGAIVCGVIGAIAINLINKYVAKQQQKNNLENQIEKKNEIIVTQDKLLNVKAEKLVNTYNEAVANITKRHEFAGRQLTDVAESVTDTVVIEKQSILADELDKLLQGN